MLRHADRELVAGRLHARLRTPVARVRDQLELAGGLTLRAANRDRQKAHRRARLPGRGEDPDPPDDLRHGPAVPVEIESQPFGPPRPRSAYQFEAAVVVQHVARQREPRLRDRLGDVVRRRDVRAPGRPVEAQSDRRKRARRPGERLLVDRGALDRGIPELDVPPVRDVSPVRAVKERVGNHRDLRARSELPVDPVEDDALIDRQRTAARPVCREEPVEGEARLNRHGQSGNDKQDHRGSPTPQQGRGQQEEQTRDDRREREQEPGPVDRASSVEESAVEKRDRRVDVELVVADHRQVGERHRQQADRGEERPA